MKQTKQMSGNTNYLVLKVMMLRIVVNPSFVAGQFILFQLAVAVQ